jgi:Na+-driven multidrug efflux pump
MAVLVNNLLKYMGGDTALSVYAIVGRLYSSLSTPQIGIMQGMQPIAGYNYGLQKYGRVRKAVRLSILTSITYGVFICLLCLAIPSGLLSILSKDTEIIKSGVPALRMMSLAYPISGVALMVTAYFQSIGKVSKAVALSFGGIVAVKIPVMAGMALLFHLNGIWLAEMISELILCIIAALMLRSCQKSLITQ